MSLEADLSSKVNLGDSNENKEEAPVKDKAPKKPKEGKKEDGGKAGKGGKGKEEYTLKTAKVREIIWNCK